MIIIQTASANEATRDDKGAIAWTDVVEQPSYEGALHQFIKKLNDEEISVMDWFRIHDGEKVINL